MGVPTLRRRQVDVPDWGGRVLVRELTGYEFGEYHTMVAEETPNRTAWIISRVVIDDAGERLFTDADSDALGRHGSIALRTVLEAALDVSGMTDASEAAISKRMADQPALRTCYALAEHLHMTVGALLASVSASELTGWAAYFEWREAQKKPGQRTKAQNDQIMLNRLEQKRRGNS